MDSLFEIVIILLILLAPVLEAVFKKKKKKGEGTQAPDPAEGPAAEADARTRRTGAHAPAGARDERSSADEMVPDDLWKVITGEHRGTRTAPPPPEPASGPGPGAEAGPRVESMEGESLETVEAEIDRRTAPTPWEAAGGEREKEWTEAGGEPEAPPAPDVAHPSGGGEEEARRRALREVGRKRTGRAALLARARPGQKARRGGARPGADARHPLIGDLDSDALRRAVVWREILGPPVSMRDE